MKRAIVLTLLRKPPTDAIKALAANHPDEAEEAVFLVIHGLQGAKRGSWVDEHIKEFRRQRRLDEEDERG